MGADDPTWGNTWVEHSAPAARNESELRTPPAIPRRTALFTKLMLAGDAAVAVCLWDDVEDEGQSSWAVANELSGTGRDGPLESLRGLSPLGEDIQMKLCQ